MSAKVEALQLNYAQKWNWVIEIDGYERAMFFTGDRPKASFDIVEINPGGTHRPVKIPGRMSFDDLTFEKGVLIANDPDFIEWMQQVQEFAEGGSASNNINNLVKDIDIVEYTHDDGEINRWTLHGAWISNYDGNDLDGSASDALTESITITYQYFTRS